MHAKAPTMSCHNVTMPQCMQRATAVTQCMQRATAMSHNACKSYSYVTMHANSYSYVTQCMQRATAMSQ